MGRRRGGREESIEAEIDTGTARLEPVPGEPDSWILYVNAVPSSPITASDPQRLDFEYLDWMGRVIDAAFPAGQALRAAHIGAAACALPRWLDARRPGSRQTAIDIDARLLELVREWFELPRAPALRLRPGDGAHEITTFRPASLDLVVRDAFAGDATPETLADEAFFTASAAALRPSGLLLANVADRPPHSALRAEIARLRAVFAHVALVADPGQVRGRRWGNVVAVASAGPIDTLGSAKALRRGPAVATVLSGAQLDRYLGIAD